MSVDAVLRAPKLLQNEAEFSALIDLFRNEGIASYLEIGSRYGGSLWRVGTSLDLLNRIVAVDLGVEPSGEDAREKTDESLVRTIRHLIKIGQEVHFIRGDSHDPRIVETVRQLGPFDAVLIDGDHTYEGARADWDNYSPMARMVVLHDISWRRPDDFDEYPRIEAPRLWVEVRDRYRLTREIRLDPTWQDNGIGVAWTR